MNYSNVIMIVSTVLLALVFFGAVFINVNIKNSKIELDDLYMERDELEQEIKRYNIEIAALTRPENIIKFIEKNNYKPVPLKDIEILKITGGE